MNSLVGDSVLDETHRPFVTQVVEKATYVRIHDPVPSLPLDSHHQRIQRVVRAPPRPESVTETPEILLIDCVEDRHHRLLYDYLPAPRCRSAFADRPVSACKSALTPAPGSFPGAPVRADLSAVVPVRLRIPPTSPRPLPAPPHASSRNICPAAD